MTFEPGCIVRVPFPYTDRSTRQRRPALVVSNGPIGDRASLLWVVMVTSADNRAWPDDIDLGASYASSGLPSRSVIRPCKVATIEALQAERIGRVPPDIFAAVRQTILTYLGTD